MVDQIDQWDVTAQHLRVRFTSLRAKNTIHKTTLSTHSNPHTPKELNSRYHSSQRKSQLSKEMDAKTANGNAAATLTRQHDQKNVSIIGDTSAQDHGAQAREVPSRRERLTLLHLPLELRLQIYGDVISEIQPRRVGVAAVQDRTTLETKSVHFVHQRRNDPEGRQNPLTFLRSCRQVYHDVKYDLNCRRQLLDRAYQFELDRTIQVGSYSPRTVIAPGLFQPATMWPADTVRRIQISNPLDPARRFDGQKLRMILRELSLIEIPRLIRALPKLTVVKLDLNILKVYGNTFLAIDPQWQIKQASFDAGLMQTNMLLFDDQFARTNEEEQSVVSPWPSVRWYHTVSHVLQVQVLRHNANVVEATAVDAALTVKYKFVVPAECADQANRMFNGALHRFTDFTK